MNTWNTFRDESFTYPNLCAKCASPGPSEVWDLKYSEIEFPEGMPASPYDQKPRNYNTYITSVQICGGCLAAAGKRRLICWLIGAAVGLIVAFTLLLAFTASTTVSPRGGFTTAVATGVFVALGVGFVLNWVLGDLLAFASYNGREQKLKFTNKDFQAQYDRLNFNYSPTTGQFAGVKGW